MFKEACERVILSSSSNSKLIDVKFVNFYADHCQLNERQTNSYEYGLLKHHDFFLQSSSSSLLPSKW